MAGLITRLGRAVTIVRRDGLGGLRDRLLLRTAHRSPGPWSLRLQGGRFRFVHRGELYAYVETFVRHVYDGVPGFTPADGWTVLDIGANVGCFSAYALCHMRRGTLFALEPNPAAHARLAEVTGAWAARRPALRVVVRQGAAGAAAGRAAFSVPDGASVRGALSHLQDGIHAQDGHEERFEVEVQPLDGWLASEGISVVDLLKMDVEGAEEDVVAGAERTLAHTARVVLEWHGAHRLAAVRAVLETAGLRLVHRAPDPDDPHVGIAYFRRGGLST